MVKSHVVPSSCQELRFCTPLVAERRKSLPASRFSRSGCPAPVGTEEKQHLNV